MDSDENKIEKQKNLTAMIERTLRGLQKKGEKKKKIVCFQSLIVRHKSSDEIDYFRVKIQKRQTLDVLLSDALSN